MFMRMVGGNGATSLVARELAALARHAARFFATAPPKDFRGHSLRSLVWRKSPQGAHTAAANLVGW